MASSVIVCSGSRRIAHSHTTATRQPACFSRSAASRSLATFAANFVAQKSARVAGMAVKRQPTWRCQKQPWTRTTAFHLGRTTSGRPGSSFGWRRKRKPAWCRPLRTRSSGLVFRPLIELIIRERVEESTRSAMPFFSSGSMLPTW